jgi:hypothetical protein
LPPVATGVNASGYSYAFSSNKKSCLTVFDAHYLSTALKRGVNEALQRELAFHGNALQFTDA